MPPDWARGRWWSWAARRWGRVTKCHPPPPDRPRSPQWTALRRSTGSNTALQCPANMAIINSRVHPVGTPGTVRYPPTYLFYRVPAADLHLFSQILIQPLNLKRIQIQHIKWVQIRIQRLYFEFSWCKFCLLPGLVITFTKLKGSSHKNVKRTL